MLETIGFEAKIFQQTFNPTYYLDYGTTEYLVSQRVVSGLSKDFVQGRFAYAETENVKFKAGWLSSVSGIGYDSILGHALGYEEMKLVNIVKQGEYMYSKTYQDNPLYGYMSL